MDKQDPDSPNQEETETVRQGKEEERQRSMVTFKSCKKQVTQQMRKAKSDYVNNIIESAFQEADTKPFWKFIRSKRGENIGVAPLKSQGKLFADGRSKAEILNNQFKSVFY